jgi:hypothetical protein
MSYQTCMWRTVSLEQQSLLVANEGGGKACLLGTNLQFLRALLLNNMCSLLLHRAVLVCCAMLAVRLQSILGSWQQAGWFATLRLSNCCFLALSQC